MMPPPESAPSIDGAEVTDELIAFLDDVQERDQSDRANARACYSRLMKRVEDFAHTDLEDRFWYAASLEALHIGQNAGLSGNMRDAIQYAKLAVEHARCVVSPFDAAWIPYLEATLAYFKEDVPQLALLVNHCGANHGVAANLLEGLRQHRNVDYARDYRR